MLASEIRKVTLNTGGFHTSNLTVTAGSVKSVYISRSWLVTNLQKNSGCNALLFMVPTQGANGTPESVIFHI